MPLDIGVGRLPAQKAWTMLLRLPIKIVNYTSAATLGPWRISTTIVADKGCNDPARRPHGRWRGLWPLK